MTASTRDDLRLLEGGGAETSTDGSLLERLALWLADVSAEALLARRTDDVDAEGEPLEPAS